MRRRISAGIAILAGIVAGACTSGSEAREVPCPASETPVKMPEKRDFNMPVIDPEYDLDRGMVVKPDC